MVQIGAMDMLTGAFQTNIEAIQDAPHASEGGDMQPGARAQKTCERPAATLLTVETGIMMGDVEQCLMSAIVVLVQRAKKRACAPALV